MEYPLRRAATAEQDLPHAANSRIRLLIVKRTAAAYPQDDADTDGWVSSTPETASHFSAVTWYFAREIEQREDVPIGVIESA
jgi:sialate O-acetylesterase